MKVSYRWLSEYVDLSGYSASELAEKLTQSGIEVDIVEKLNKGVSNVVVGYVKACAKHPDADKLSVCTVDVGQGTDLQIVCGAKNVAAGQKVPVALDGATLPGDVRIKRTKLRGVESMGMICSAKELGLNDKLLPKELQEGILVLPGDCEIGAPITDVLNLDDEVLELDLTPNRSDCLSMIGVAHEIAAIIGREVKLPDEIPPETAGTKTADTVAISISAPDYCSRYAARRIENVTVGPSPLWMQNRLMAAGVRPINNVVDITNYVMLEYGQPLHAFDADKLEGGRIDVRLARDGETIRTLDGTERRLTADMLLIADGVKPVAVAGVMGGADSEVTPGTTAVLLESAHFAGGSVRKTSRQLGLRSEASLRFEKEANPEAVIPALNRAAALMVRYAGGRVCEGIAQAEARAHRLVEAAVTLAKINGHLGTNLSLAEVRSIFDRLGFAHKVKDGDTLLVRVPARRGDIARDVDLIEEVARLHGYDRIPTTPIEGVTTPGALSPEQKIRRAVRRLLTGSGFHEVVTYSFTHPDQIARFPGLYPEAKPVRLAMPMSEERSVLRTSLVPHLIDVAVYNRNRNVDDAAVFEIGKVFVSGEDRLSKLPDEKWLLGVLWTGARQPKQWNGKAEPVDFYDLKGIFEKIAAYLGIAGIAFEQTRAEGFHPGRAADIVVKSERGAETIGRIGQLHPDLQREKEIADTYVLEVEMAALCEKADVSIVYKPLPKYPGIGRDLAVVVRRDVPVEAMLECARDAAGPILESADVFDVYTDERLGENRKSVALSLMYRHPERTLTDEEAADLHQRIVRALEQTFGAELRK
jgi:phenylalanyl-tRNA synthetase beta chain